MTPDNLLMVADSERDADMLYAVGMFVAEPFVYLRLGGRSLIVLNDSEIGRRRKEASHCRIISRTRCEKRLKQNGAKSVGTAQVIRLLLRERGIRRIFVPSSFPHGLARQLRDLKVKLKVREGSLFPEREIKSAEELKKISAALIMAEVGMAEGLQALRSAKIGKNGRLLYHNVPLTAEKLRSIIDIAVIQAGGVACRTVVACGRQACDLHERGRGLLRANQPILMNILPRSQKTGYFGDIARTVVRGHASESIRNVYQTVLKAQEVAFAKLRHRMPGSEVHRAVLDHFLTEGYLTRRHNGAMEGYCHGTGHGLGLEGHESPWLGPASKSILQVGHVVTVQPGLYYPSLAGGVRLEDVALVTSQGARNLTKFEKVLEV